jgi:hypothetical protein
MGSELDHVASDTGELPPEPLLMLAVACTEVPDAIDVVGSFISRDELGPVIEPPPPPHAAKTSDNAARIAETRRIWRVSPLRDEAERPSRAKRAVHMLSLLPTRGELKRISSQVAGSTDAWSFCRRGTARRRSEARENQFVFAVRPAICQPVGDCQPAGKRDACSVSSVRSIDQFVI